MGCAPGPLKHVSSRRWVSDLGHAVDAYGVIMESIDPDGGGCCGDSSIWFLGADPSSVLVTDVAPPSGDTGAPWVRPFFHVPSAQTHLENHDSFTSVEMLLATLLTTDNAVAIHQMTGDAYDTYGRRFDTLTLWLGLRRSVLDLARLTGQESYQNMFQTLCTSWEGTHSFAQRVLQLITEYHQ